MNKEELLQELSAKISTGEITQEEVLTRFNYGIPAPLEPQVEETKKFSSSAITKMLYVLGAAVVIIGIVIFVAQIWDDIGSLSRIAVTLGLGLLIAAIGSMLLKQKPENSIGAIFHFIGGMLIPGGAMVTLTESDSVSIWPVAITFGVIFAFYLLLSVIHKHAILTMFAIINGTAFIELLLRAVLNESIYRYESLFTYLRMSIGASYLLLAHAFKEGWNEKLLGALHFFGSGVFLGAAFSLVIDGPLWEFLYFLIVIGGLILSVYMKSKTVLIMSTLFLIAHISYITNEYFADSLGWPISLVILGFIFIGLGYTSVSINKKYIVGASKN